VTWTPPGEEPPTVPAIETFWVPVLVEVDDFEDEEDEVEAGEEAFDDVGVVFFFAVVVAARAVGLGIVCAATALRCRLLSKALIPIEARAPQTRSTARSTATLEVLDPSIGCETKAAVSSTGRVLPWATIANGWRWTEPVSLRLVTTLPVTDPSCPARISGLGLSKCTRMPFEVVVAERV
jgi:hypothetical protein